MDRQGHWKTLWSDIRKDYSLYLLIVPGMLIILLFKYTPMYGIVIAFKDFNIFDGYNASPWVGMKHFEKLFTTPDFLLVFRNTLIISVYKLVFLFPLPIVIALMLYELKQLIFKRVVQTIIYLPHFLSWVIVSGLFIDLLSTNGGLVNKLLVSLGMEPITFFLDNSVFRGLLVSSAGWKEVGWGTIVYLAAFATIDPQLYDAAKIDGAGRWKQLLHITLPGISSTIILMLILRLGSILEAGTEQILVMYNPTVYKVSDVIGTYVYRMGLGNQDYSFTTAVGLFESVIAFILVISGNALSRKYLQRGIW
ncbi:ABC transporter permease [Paenibacillus sp. 1001270B_150601_E10]|uniref:ABC transporter permease n=1 Tax=Paenibacillus sp. 1001270B_150601_E10 TaxID=2787079 RepID=UPI00189F5B51|nr:ABC transporter permease subunit [Paenibacillus sp. 1001270B_150601_E10]